MVVRRGPFRVLLTSGSWIEWDQERGLRACACDRTAPSPVEQSVLPRRISDLEVTLTLAR